MTSGLCRSVGVVGLALWLLTGPAAALAEVKAVLAERLHRADIDSALDAAGVSPWHLKMAVQLFNEKGKPGEQGTIEEWWGGPGLQRVVYTTGSHVMTELESAGQSYRTKGTGSAPELLTLLRDQVVHPLPPASDVEAAKLKLEKKPGKLDLECIMLNPMTKGIDSPPLGLFPTYCFEPKKNWLRMSYDDLGSQVIVRNAIGKFQMRTVATQVAVTVDGVQAASGQVQTLESTPLSAKDFVKTEDLEAVTKGPAEFEMGAHLLTQVEPQYTEAAKLHHASGTVVLHAIISREGKIRSLQLVNVPNPELAMAAMAAVRRWTYKPYLVNGVPTEVNTTIRVNFDIR